MKTDSLSLTALGFIPARKGLIYGKAGQSNLA
jgi:hypothetical protein